MSDNLNLEILTNGNGDIQFNSNVMNNAVLKVNIFYDFATQ